MSSYTADWIANIISRHISERVHGERDGGREKGREKGREREERKRGVCERERIESIKAKESRQVVATYRLKTLITGGF